MALAFLSFARNQTAFLKLLSGIADCPGSVTSIGREGIVRGLECVAAIAIGVFA